MHNICQVRLKAEVGTFLMQLR